MKYHNATILFLGILSIKILSFNIRQKTLCKDFENATHYSTLLLIVNLLLIYPQASVLLNIN